MIIEVQKFRTVVVQDHLAAPALCQGQNDGLAGEASPLGDMDMDDPECTCRQQPSDLSKRFEEKPELFGSSALHMGGDEGDVRGLPGIIAQVIFQYGNDAALDGQVGADHQHAALLPPEKGIDLFFDGIAALFVGQEGGCGNGENGGLQVIVIVGTEKIPLPGEFLCDLKLMIVHMLAVLFRPGHDDQLFVPGQAAHDGAHARMGDDQL